MTGSTAVVPGSLPVQKPITSRTLELLDAMSAVDSVLYTHALTAETSEAEAKRICDSTFAAELVRLGDIGGIPATAQSFSLQLAETEVRLAGLSHELGTLEDDLARHRAWLEGIQESASWRMTAPARAAKRRLLGVEARPKP